MNDKISMRRLAAALPGFDGIDEDQKVVITKELFAEIADILAGGDEVKITGLGSFAVSTAKGGEKEVIFTPAPEVAAVVNAPFAAFSPDELCDAVSDQMLDEINTLDSPAPEEPIVTVEEIPVIAEPAEEIPAADETVEASVPGPAEAEIKPEEEFIPEPQPVVVPGEVEETPVSTMTIPATPPDRITPVVDVEPHPVVVPAPSVEEEVVKIETPQPEPQASLPVTDEEPDDKYYRRRHSHHHSSRERQKSRFGLGFLCGILSGLAIGGMALLAYILYQINTAPASGYDDYYDEDIEMTEMIDEI